MPYFIALILLFQGMCGMAEPPDRPQPTGGVLDLRESAFDRNSLYNLNGEWEFYWEELLTPDSYSLARTKGQGMVVSVPSYWESYEIEGEKLPGYGYGTYALTVLLPPETRIGVCVDIPVFDVAYNFYLNDRLVGSNGTVGTNLEEEKPWYEPSRFCYIPDSDTLQFLVQVSNFHHRRGGFWQSVLLGGSDQVLKRTERKKIYNYSTIGVLFFFTIFFLIFWLFNRQNTLMLLFALTALGILMRSVNTGLYFSNSFVYTPWNWQIRMEYTGTYLAHLFGMIFLHRVFHRKYMDPVITGNCVLTGLLMLSVFIFPPRLFTYGMLIFQPLILLFLLHYLVISLIGTFRGKALDTIFFVSLGLFMYSMVNDIMVANTAGAANTSYISQLAFQVFIFAVAVMIVMQWVRNYNARVQLESSLRFKNRVLSVIAHDLKNPVASIAQFSDLLATKPELTGKQQILNSLQESSQAAVSLLDNLLYWGRSQADQLKVTRADFDMGQLVADVQSLYIHMATQKGIELKSEVFPGTTVHADKALVNIVVRNLVSNAIKFTPAGGRVHILAQAEDGKVRLTVSDTGVGIKPEILEQFRKEGQLRSTEGTDQEIGTGLGLQLVDDLVARNGGKFKTESTPGVGTTFSFTLPGGKSK